MLRLLIVLPLLSFACGARREQEGALPSPTPQPHAAGNANDTPRSHQEGLAVKPAEVEGCLEKASVKGRVNIRADKKPQYLKGDFDGDGLSDYALAVRGYETGKNGVLICTGQGEAIILGADNPTEPPFSDMPNDNFVAPKWKIFTRKEALEIHDPDQEPSTPVASPKGDSIAMLWEDGICLIYWDGTRYRWGCGQ